MGLISLIKGVIGKMFKKEAEKIFDCDIVTSAWMDVEIRRWYRVVGGSPEWKSKDDDVKSINFAKFLCSDTAKKICLDIDINVTGSARADYLQNVMEELKKVLRDKVEDACGVGGIMFKPNGSDNVKNCIDYVQADDFMVTEKTTNGDIRGCIFIDFVQMGDDHYKRLEYHRFEGEHYLITNKAFKSKSHNALGHLVSLDKVPAWANIEEEVSIDGLERPLFAYFKMPMNNTIDYDSPLGVSIFSNAIEELRDLDIAWSRKGGEVEDSKHMTFVGPTAVMYANNNDIKLPRFLKPVDLGDDVTKDPVHEHVATLLTDQRIADINSVLSMISTKCGFSQGQFVLDRKTGQITATQVESDDHETIETIKEMRDALRDTIEQLIYALDAYASLYDLAPLGVYETSYSFGDLTYNYDEDRTRHWQYVMQGKFPLWRYYVKFEGMSEEEAKEIVAEAQGENQQEGLFKEE